MKKILLGLLFFCSLKSIYAQTNLLDPSFGKNGIVTSDIDSIYNYSNYGRQVLVQPDGSMYFVSESAGLTLITKRLPDGSINVNYGNNGYSAAVPIYSSHATLQPDGKIVVVGYTLNAEQYFYNTKDFAVARFNTDGSLDNSFDGDGITSTDFSDNDVANAVAIQTDGKIVVVGDITDDAGDRTFFGLARFNTDGSLDETLNGNGKQKTDLSDIFESAKAVAIQSDGFILVAGDVSNGENSDFVLVRYDPNGNLDNTFSEDGAVYTGFGPGDDYVNSIAIQNDGKVLVGGFSPENFELARYNTDGILDDTFNGDGRQITDFGDAIANSTSLVLQVDGNILLAGSTGDNNQSNFAIARYNKSGQPDITFSGDGKQVTGFGSVGYVNSIALQQDGKVVALGYTNDGNNTYVAATRYNNNGTLDNAFDDDGKLIDHINQGSTFFTSTAVQNDGKVVAAGYTWNGSNYDFALVRYNRDGSFDNAFANNGKQTTDFNFLDDKARAVAIQNDSKIVVAGSAGENFGIVRYNADGSLDNTFSNDGKQATDFGSTDSITSLAIQTDGKIIAAGSALARYNINGTLDASFSGDGKLTTSFNCSDVAIQTDGKIVVAGEGSVARYNINGSADTRFGTNGQNVLIDENNLNFREDYKLYCKSIALQNDGKIVIGGYYEHDYRGISSSFTLIRLNTNGTLDNSFDRDGIVFSSPGLYLLDYGTSVAVQEDNKIILGGYSYDGSSDDFALVRYDADGRLDNTFSEGGVMITPASSGYDRIADILISGNYLYAAGYGQFPGNFGVIAKYLLSAGGPLPVTLSNFIASAQTNTTVLLKWQTAKGQNVLRFVIERSADGNIFSQINTEPAKGINNSTADYSLIDQQPLKGTNFYRLKMVDADGNIKYSEVVAVNFKNFSFALKIFPNPASNILFVQASGENENAAFRIIDAGGKKLKEVKVTLNGNTSLSFYVNTLPKGIYTLQLHTKLQTESRVFIKE